jgi:formylglycine-generating enzyme required for sulfatase activity
MRTKRFVRYGFLVCAAAALCAAALCAAGCGNPFLRKMFNQEESVLSSGPPSYPFTTPPLYREMVSLTGVNLDGSAPSVGYVFINSRPLTINSFRIAKFETTYELWEEVRGWAIGHGYTFANAGWEGHQAAGTTPGTGTTNELTHGWTAAQKKTRPVTTVNWRDAVVWCNAYSEMSGKVPVYYTDTTYGTVLKTSTNAAGTTEVDTAVRKPGANGYRLPTEAEWEYAARGGNMTAPEWPYDYAGTNNSGQLGNYAWYEDNTFANLSLGYTYSDYGAHPVGTKLPNTAHLYDMTGNVWEWCWDWYVNPIITTTPPDGPSTGNRRVLRGGEWSNDETRCRLSNFYGGEPPYHHNEHLGFRVVCAP